ncbi:MAG: EFR1 family ferrodoxin [Oscillospiraceae bacterium]
MIFYFSATGNSLYAANYIADENESVISIKQAIKEKSYGFSVPNGEKVGFVFPTYFYGIPNIIIDFLNNLKLEFNGSKYIYLVLTCGAITANAAEMFEKQLSKSKNSLSAKYSVKMVDTYVPLFKIDDLQKQNEILLNADKQLRFIKIKIDKKAEGNFEGKNKGPLPALVTATAYPLYKNGRKTKKFEVTNDCIGCGLCENICPANAIKIKNNKPVWIKETCTLCLGCLHRCPEKAIQYGEKSKTNGRYVNPRVKL